MIYCMIYLLGKNFISFSGTGQYIIARIQRRILNPVNV